jgi:hypothetical protein
MRKISETAVWLAIAGTALAQVVSPPEIRDVQMRELQQKHLAELKAVATSISAHAFPYRLYFSRALDLNEEQQQRSDQRSIRFDKFRTQTVLEITANYYASYSAELMQKEQRASQTLRDVIVPMLERAVPALSQEEKLQGFGFEISHHVRRKVLGVGAEYPENVAFILPRDAAQRYMAAGSSAEKESALREGSLFVDSHPLAGWGPSDVQVAAERRTQTAAAQPDAKSAVGTALSSPAVPSLPHDVERAAAASATPPARLAAEPRLEVSKDSLSKLQSANQEALDRLVRELNKAAHFVSYAPPLFIEFHKGAYLQLSVTTTLNRSEPASQYRLAALAFDEHISHLIRPVLVSLKTRPDFDGIDFSTSVRLAGAAEVSAEAVEFIFPTPTLVCYEQYDCSGQQLINQGFVLINGERVSLDLQSAEANVGGAR